MIWSCDTNILHIINTIIWSAGCLKISLKMEVLIAVVLHLVVMVPLASSGKLL